MTDRDHLAPGGVPEPRPTGLRADERGDVPMRIAPLLLVGLILVVLAIVGGALL